MKERNSKGNKKNDDNVTSISTPLGHITVDSQLVNQSFIDWTKNILSNEEDEKNE